MEKDVKICIKGLHSVSGDESDITEEIIGTYYFKNGKHYVCFEKADEDSGNINKNTIKMQENNIEIIKHGGMHLHFEKNKLNNTYYKTVMGNLLIGIDTKDIHLSEEDNMVNAMIKYAIYMEEEKVSDCIVEIKVFALESA